MAFPGIPTAAAGRVLTRTQADALATRTFPDLSGLTKNAGDRLIAIIAVYQSSAAAGAVFSGWTGGFVEIADRGGTTANMSIGVAEKVSTGAETGTFTVTQAATITGHAMMIVMSIPGAHASTASEVSAIAHGTTAAADPPALDPAGWGAEDSLWISVGANGETSLTGSYTGMGLAAGPPTNYSDAVSTGESGDVIGAGALAVAFRQLNATSENAGPWSSIDLSNARNSALVIAVRPAPPPTPTAITPMRLSMAAATDPNDDTGHVIKVRARKTGGTGTVTIGAALYEGATNRSGNLASSALTTSFAEYSIAIPSASMANVTSYADLELRLWADSSTGDTTNVEIARAWIETPAPPLPTITLTPASLSFNAAPGGSNPANKTFDITNTGVGTLSWSITDDATWLSVSPTSGTTDAETDTITVSIDITGLSAGTYNGTITVTAAGASNTPQTLAVTLNVVAPKAVGAGRYDLALGVTPATRTDHYIGVRARKINSAESGVVRVQVFEGATAITGDLDSSELTTSAADYLIAIPDADAADITDYSNLEIEVDGYAPAGDTTDFEIYKVWFQAPGPAADTGLTIAPTSIGSSEAWGAPTLVRGAISLVATPIASSEAWGSPAVTPGAISVLPGSIASSEAWGSPSVNVGATSRSLTGIASSEAWGLPVMQPGAVSLAAPSIPTAEAWGLPAVTPGSISRTMVGIASAEAWGAVIAAAYSRFYATDSPFNEDIPLDAPSDPDSALIIAKLTSWLSQTEGQAAPEEFHVGYNGSASDFDHPIYFAKATDPLITVNRSVAPAPEGLASDWWGTAIRIPAYAKPAQGADRHMVVIQPDGTEWSLYKVQENVMPAEGNPITAVGFGKSDINGSGLNIGVGDAVAGRTGAAAGVIRIWEMAQSALNHALFGVVRYCAPEVVYPDVPASSVNGTSNGRAREHKVTLASSVTLPQATITVNESLASAQWPTSGAILIGGQRLTYTGKTTTAPFQFTGVSGGTGTFAAGTAVYEADCPPVGSLLQLQMTDAEIDALTAPPWAKLIYKVMAHKGIFVLDTSAAGSWYVEPESSIARIQEAGGIGVADDPWRTWAAGAGLSFYATGGYYYGVLRNAGINWSTRLRVVDPSVVAPAQAITASGIASGEAWGATGVQVRDNISPTSIPSSEAFGAPSLIPAAISRVLSGIASSEAWGSTVLGSGAATIVVSGIPSAESWGSPSLIPGAFGVSLVSILSAEAWGSPSLSPGAISVSLAGIATSEAWGLPSLLRGAISVSLAGIASSESWGSPSLTQGAFSISLVGIASAEAWGTITWTPEAISRTLVGIASAEAWGLPTLVVLGPPPEFPDYDFPLMLYIEPTVERSLLIESTDKQLVIEETPRSLTIEDDVRSLTISPTILRSLTIPPVPFRSLTISETLQRLLVIDDNVRSLNIEEK